MLGVCFDANFKTELSFKLRRYDFFILAVFLS